MEKETYEKELDVRLREIALSLALGDNTAPVANILERAEAYYQFLKGGK